MLYFVTSMNGALFDRFGHRMIQSVLERGTRTSLTVVWEGPESEALKNLVAVHPSLTIMEESTEAKRFRARFGSLSEANGWKLIHHRTDGNLTVELIKNYRYDAIRLSHKVFAVDKVANSREDISNLCWLDADCVAISDYTPEELAPTQAKDEYLMSYLGRTNKYSECGFLSFNLANPATRQFINAVTDLYRSGELFALDEFHDSFAWDWVRKKYEQDGFMFLNISDPTRRNSHPFVNSLLGRYFDHLKGPARKSLGKSLPRDYMT